MIGVMVSIVGCGDNVLPAPPTVRTIVAGRPDLMAGPSLAIAFTPRDEPIAIFGFDGMFRLSATGWETIPGTDQKTWIDFGIDTDGSLIASRGYVGVMSSTIDRVDRDGLGPQVGPAIENVYYVVHPIGLPSGTHYIRWDRSSGRVWRDRTTTWDPYPIAIKYPVLVGGGDSLLAMTFSGLVTIARDGMGGDTITPLLGCETLPGGDCASTLLAGRDSAGRLYLAPTGNTALLVLDPGAATWHPMWLPDGWRVERAVVGRDGIVIRATHASTTKAALLWAPSDGVDFVPIETGARELTSSMLLVADRSGGIYLVDGDGSFASIGFAAAP